MQDEDPCDDVEEEDETEQIIHCECCSKELGLSGFTNNKGSFCSNICLQLWTGCPNICSEMVHQIALSSVSRRLDFETVAAAAAEDFSAE